MYTMHVTNGRLNTTCRASDYTLIFRSLVGTVSGLVLYTYLNLVFHSVAYTACSCIN